MKAIARLKWFQGIVGGLATAVLVLGRLPEEDRPSWADGQFVTYIAVVSLVLAAAVVPIVEGVVRRFSYRRSVLAKDVMELLHVEFPLVVDAAGIGDFRVLGMHVFLRRHTWRRPVRGVQRRIARIRLARVGIDHELEWVWGKGVIGQCWKDLRDKGLNYGSWRRKHQGIGEEAWNQLDERERWGLTYDEFERTATNFGGIVATPIFNQRGKFLGTVSADGPQGTYQGLTSAPVGEVLQACAQVIARYLEGVSD